MSSDVTVPKAQIDQYQTRIQDLERENNHLRDSKLKLIMNTAREIERMRQYIYSLTTTMQQTNKPDIEEPEEKARITLCEHCGSTSNVNNNYYISISSAGAEAEAEVAAGPGGTHINDAESDYNEEDDGKQASLDNMDISSDDDEDIDIDEYQITPGRVSVITRGNSVHLTAQDLPSFATDASMGEHADIPLPDNFMDDSFVICDYCTSNLPLQFVRKYPDTMQCSKCSAFFEFIFLCNECGKCVCSECYEYEAKMQSIDRITNNFTGNQMDESSDSQRLILFQQRLNNESASTLHRFIADYCALDEFSLKLCYLICFFMDDLDLCPMLNTSFVAELFDIYWTLSPPKISFQRKFGFSDVHLMHSLTWAETNDKNHIWCIKDVIDNDIMIDNYLSKDYQEITYDGFIQKLTKYVNETNTHYAKLLNLLKLVTQRNNVLRCEELDYNQYAWRELGGAPSICSKGYYFVWNIPILQRSYCFNVDNRMLDQPFNNK